MKTSQSTKDLYSYNEPVPQFRRLVVLVPDADIDEIRAARCLRRMMNSNKEGIFLLSILRGNESDPQVQRRLANLAAILRDPVYKVTARTLARQNWSSQLRQNLLPHDLLVCFPGDRIAMGRFTSRSVDQVVRRELQIPVVLLTGLEIVHDKEPQWIRHTLGWAISLAIILVFLHLDIAVIKNTPGYISTFLLVFVTVLEAGVIWDWNNFID